MILLHFTTNLLINTVFILQYKGLLIHNIRPKQIWRISSSGDEKIGSEPRLPTPFFLANVFDSLGVFDLPPVDVAEP